MMRILRSLESREIQQQISSLRAGSKEDILAQLHISLEMYSQMKEKLETAQGELLDAKIIAENQNREICELKKTCRHSTHGNNRERSERHLNSVANAEFYNENNNDENILIDGTHENIPERGEILHVPQKFSSMRNGRVRAPDGSGGSCNVIQTMSGKRFFM